LQNESNEFAINKLSSENLYFKPVITVSMIHIYAVVFQNVSNEVDSSISSAPVVVVRTFGRFVPFYQINI